MYNIVSEKPLISIPAFAEDGQPSFANAAAERLRQLRSGLKSRLAKGDSSQAVKLEAPDPSLPSSEFSPQVRPRV